MLLSPPVMSYSARHVEIFLETMFSRCPYPDESNVERVAAILGTTVPEIDAWFKRRLVKAQLEGRSHNAMNMVVYTSGVEPFKGALMP